MSKEQEEWSEEGYRRLAEDLKRKIESALLRRYSSREHKRERGRVRYHQSKASHQAKPGEGPEKGI